MKELITSRLVLKAVSEEDIPSYSKYFNDYKVIRYLSAEVPWPYPENGVRDFLRNVIIPQQGNNRWVWGIYLKSKPKILIRCIDLWRKGTPENRGFWLAHDYWGMGIMTEASIAVIDYAFTDLGFKKMIFSNAVENIASRRIKEKTGCRFIGTIPARFVDPKLTVSELWELTKDDWTEYQHRFS
ncbi:GNAT family N-acetyltransferase [Olivibacter sp. CPCC 100613]|uniref:GNAT family N-acetyltransferase n=1 Tax=Olivibacter sp. CPCC 100613 TaxID=3079931 RepID=UPI002FF83B70